MLFVGGPRLREGRLYLLYPLNENNKIEMTNPHSYGVFASKSFLAHLSEESEKPYILTKEEINVVRELVPWTRIINWISEIELNVIRKEPQNYVLKKCESYRGSDVYIGHSISLPEWNKRIDHALLDSGNFKQSGSAWIIQEYIKTKPQVVFEVTAEGFCERIIDSLCIAPYLFGDQLGGVVSWFRPNINETVLIGNIVLNKEKVAK